MTEEELDNYVKEKKENDEKEDSVECANNPKTNIDQGILRYKAIKNCPKDGIHGFSEIRVKDSADCLEALIGVYYENGGEKAAVKVMDWLEYCGPNFEGKPVFFNDVKLPNRIIHSDEISPEAFLPDISSLEQTISYKFNDRWWAVEALTHPSFITDQLVGSYERLEFVGDGILDLIICEYITNKVKTASPGLITVMRMMLVNNNTLAMIVVKYGMHKHILISNDELKQSIEDFEMSQKVNNFEMQHEVTLTEENGMTIAREVESPKALADILESLCGAIYFDCGRDLTVVSRIIWKLMERELDIFTQSRQVSPSQFMNENQYIMRKTSAENAPEREVTYIRNGFDRKFVGRGKCFDSAKNAAAKYGMQTLMSETKELKK